MRHPKGTRARVPLSSALHAQIAAEGRLLPSVDLADTHGQFKFNFKHAAISRDESKTLLVIKGEDGDFDFRHDGTEKSSRLHRTQSLLAQCRTESIHLEHDFTEGVIAFCRSTAN